MVKKCGLHTLVIENHMKKSMYRSMGFDFGWGMGYVLLPSNHPFYGVHYDNLAIDAHGGLTFSEIFESKNFLEWVEGREFFGDVTRENFERFDNYWIIGFDTNHYGDDLMSCSKEFVINETNSVLEQCLDDEIEGMKKYKNIYQRKDKLKIINNI
jgi:hypothetical protein